ncbi:kinesin-like protein KIFC3 isoform X2 [Liolophura sinensis]|uniref:kinesin-like protein KIFC3 isoform X2 n=1 Tax=Liolophura sinensis TaxID=3198878 RepID=UPI0031580A98
MWDRKGRASTGFIHDTYSGRHLYISGLSLDTMNRFRTGTLSSPRSSGPCSFVEYQTLKRELADKNSERDELLYKIRTLTDSSREHKSRLEKEEATRRQQVKILQKAHEDQLKEKERVIVNLRDEIEENAARMKELQQQFQGHNSSHSPPLASPSPEIVQELHRLQAEKVELTRELTRFQEQLKSMNKSTTEEANLLHKQIKALKKEKEMCLVEITKLKSLVQNSETGPCSTDNEKQIDKLQLENEKLVHQVADLRHTLTSKSGGMYGEHLQKTKSENHKLKLQLDSMEEEMLEKSEEHDKAVRQLKSQNLRLMKEKQYMTQQIRSMREEVKTLQKQLEVKGVDFNSGDLRQSYEETQAANQMLGEQIQRLKGMCDELKTDLYNTRNHNATLQQQVNDFTSEVAEVNRQMATEIHELERHKEEAVVATRKEMEQKFRSLRTNYEKLRLKLSLIHPLLTEVLDSYERLKRECYMFPELLKASVEHIRQETYSAISEISKQNKDLLQKYRQELTLRRKIHNELVELKGNIRVFCRVRPRTKEDLAQPGSELVVSYDADDDTVVKIFHKGQRQSFEMDKVFRENSSQVEVFEEVQSLVTSCIDGYNVCIFSYGQTGSGKTYTMEGTHGSEGINQRALQLLFEEVTRKGGNWTYTICVSVLEIYNESIRDLLRKDKVDKLEVKMSPDRGYHVPGLTSVKVTSLNDVNTVFSVGQQNRAMAMTSMNDHSSRSHSILCVTVLGVNKATNSASTGHLNLVDLAGSERVSKSGADGARLKEAQNINKSLSSLGDVIHALRTKQNFVPYRNSRLTYLLQDSLKGDSKTLMIVQVAPTERHVSETLCSLHFAKRVRTVELGAATRRVEATNIENKSSKMPPPSSGRTVTKTTSYGSLPASGALVSTSSSSAIAAHRVAQITASAPGRNNSAANKKTPLPGKSPLARAVTPLLKPIRRKLNIQ